MNSDYIDSVEVQPIPTIRLGSQATVVIKVKSNSQPYIGPLTYHIRGKDGINLVKSETIDNYDGSAELNFIPQTDAIESHDTVIMIYVENHVSSVSTSQPMTIIGKLSRSQFRVCI